MTVHFVKDWKKADFLAYFLQFGGSPDPKELDEEILLLKSKVGESCFQRALETQIGDNQIQSSRKIMDWLSTHGFSYDDKTELLYEVLDEFIPEGQNEVLQRNIVRAVNKLLG